MSMAPAFKGTDRFAIRESLGSGAFGMVYLADDLKRKSRVALKVLRNVDPDGLYRFKQEFRALADLQHPNLVKLHELLSEGDQWFFTMELVEGANFLQYIWKTRIMAGQESTDDQSTLLTSSGGSGEFRFIEQRTETQTQALASEVSFDEERLRSSLRQLAEGIIALHAAGKLHRDIKPSNVLVTQEGRVVLLDFGLIKELAGDSLTQSMQVVGTPAYMSPEQGAGLSVSQPSDWYSVGVMLYQALTGRVPFTGSFFAMLRRKQQGEFRRPRDVIPAIPEDLDSLCRDLLRASPEDRPPGHQVLERLLTTAPGPRRTAAGSAPQTIPMRFVGRRQHLAALTDAFRAMKAGRAVTVLLHGGSGMGKSVLMRRFFEQLRRDHPDAVLLAGRCYAQESVPYKGFDTLIDALSQYLRSLPRSEVEGLMPRDVLALARVFPVLRQVHAVAEARRRVLEIPDSQELRRRAFAALREILSRLADQRPLVLFIDDLQWGDLDSAKLLEEILQPPDAPAMLIIACYRTEEADTSPLTRSLLRFRQEMGASLEMRELLLGELTPSESRDLVLSLAEEEPHAVLARAGTIAQEAGGSPYFITELVRYRRSRPGDWAQAGGQAGETTLDEVIQTRVSGLAEAPRRMLEVLAVAGQPLDANSLGQAAGVSAEERAEALDKLRAEHLARSRGTESSDEFELYHARIGETIVSHLSEEGLKAGHRQIALALEASPKADAERLFVHFHRAGELAAAGRYAAAAAAQASEALAFDRAARLYRVALDLHPAGEAQEQRLRVKLAEALANAGRGEEAAYAFLSASESARPSESIDLQRRAAEQFLRGGHIDSGLQTLRTVLTALNMSLPETPGRALLSFLLHRARIRLRGLGFQERNAASVPANQLLRLDTCWSVAVGLGMVDTIRGADYQARHLLLALKAGEPFRVVRALALEISYSANGGGRTRFRTEQLALRTLELAKRLDNPHALALVYLTTGIAAYLEGRWSTAVEMCVRAEDLLRDECTGVSQEIDSCHHFQLRSLTFLGEFNKLSRRLPGLLKDAEERGDLYGATMLAIRNLYITHLCADDVATGRRRAREAIGRWSQQGFHNQHYIYLCAQTEMDLYCGDGASAFRRITERWKDLARSLLLRVQFAYLESSHLRARCALAAAEGKSEKTSLLRLAAQDAERIERERMQWADPLARLIRAALARSRGEHERAIEMLTVAEGEFTAAGMRLYAAAARRRRGALTGGDEGKALVRAADGELAAQGVRNPERMTAMLTPGL